MRTSARTAKRIHFWLAIIWLLLAIPTLLWWMDSVAWVSWMSLYAIVATHWAGYQGAMAQRSAES